MVYPFSMLMLVLAIGWMELQPAASQCLTEGDASPPISEKSRKILLHRQLLFSTDLLKTVTETQTSGNIFFSPASVFNALLLAYFVAGNQTEDSLKKTLHLEDQEKVNTLGAYIYERYCKKLRSIKGAANNYQLSNANRMYITREEKLLPCVKKQFREEIEQVDFDKNVTDTILKINNWVSAQTRGNIKELLSPDSLNSNTNLVLVNAAYFKGFWKQRFSPDDTRDVDFTLANGTKVSTKMMSQESKFSHQMLDELGAEMLELPYEGDDISMYILLPLNPSPSAVAELLNKTDAKTILQIVNKSPSFVGDVSVLIPKFTIDETLTLTPILESMGVGDLFQNSADLSKLTGSPGLHLDTIVHKAKITVDETGTEAAAATAIFANRFAADTFSATHPFIYFLYDKKENILLFVGVFNSPDT